MEIRLLCFEKLLWWSWPPLALINGKAVKRQRSARSGHVVCFLLPFIWIFAESRDRLSPETELQNDRFLFIFFRKRRPTKSKESLVVTNLLKYGLGHLDRACLLG